MRSIKEIQVMFLANVTEPITGENRVQVVTLTVDPKAIFGEWDVAQINGFFVRMDWQPETPIELKPSPYYLG